MRELNKLQSSIFLLGGVLMVLGAGAFALMWQRAAASWVYLAGALMFALMQCAQTYDGPNRTVRRLKGIMTVADICFVLAGLLMIDTHWKLMLQAFPSYVEYYQMLYNKWVVVLLVAAVLETYTIHRISHILEQDATAAPKS